MQCDREETPEIPLKHSNLLRHFIFKISYYLQPSANMMKMSGSAHQNKLSSLCFVCVVWCPANNRITC